MKRRLPPEIAALTGVLIVWIVFALVAGPSFRSWSATHAILTAAAPLAILAVSVALLMIAGEFDLSIGSVIGVCSMSIMLLVEHFGVPLLIALPIALVLALGIGMLNGALVTRNGLPSFIVTLGTLFM